ncbi:thiamine phosphate synthase [Pseudodesulfovibrio sediminis]|uniref:Thiamine-phosphate synthase n=1 Tax=Pseudodesulfovibrio sediminis TaxID=2810563 RepID=A0ABN6ENA0_9BACT|nr:thiamine phosphate synthase [Pseudodesulfovibrio sediminis]BCS87661.1 thiamine-phosphate synthase [Pseudodesulfovibrio sediminis]
MTREITRRNILDTDIYCLTGEKFSLDRPNIAVVRDMLEAGVKIVQYREKEKKMGMKYEECLKIREMTREAGAAFIVNDDIDLAMIVEADGVHVGQKDIPIEAVRRLVGDKMAIGLSTHSPVEAHDAVKRGADYIGVGPIFATQTKDDVCDPVGFEYLEYVVKYIDIPFVAIGGIKEHNIGEVIKRGASCVALVTEIVGQKNIKKKITALRQQIEAVKE